MVTQNKFVEMFNYDFKGLKTEGLVLEDMSSLEEAGTEGLESEEAVLETLKTRSTLEEQQLLAAHCDPHTPTMDTDGNLRQSSLSCNPASFCSDAGDMADLSDEGLSQLASHGKCCSRRYLERKRNSFY
jgi:hypothetical protein